jgi:CRP-like cAMP-binding protein
METIDAVIAEHPFFKGLDPSVLRIVGGCGSNVRVNAGEYLFHEGDEAERFYAVRHGMVALEIYVPQRGQVTVQTVGAGEIIGWSWLFPPYVCQFSARAVEIVRATSFDGACLRKKCDEDTAMGYELMKRLAHVVSQRLEATRLQLLDIYGPAVDTK